MLLVLAGLLRVSQPTSAADGNFVNLSNRGLVGEGDDVRIVGFIIEGGARQVLIQAKGPELANDGISNALADPVLTVIQTHEGEPPRTPLDPPVELMVNDNWEDSQGQMVSDLWGGSPPLTAGSLSAAVVLTLEPGGYTARVEGKNGTVGVANVEVYRIASAGTTSDVPPAPQVETSTGTDTELEIWFADDFQARETRAYDYQIRTKTPQGQWNNFCDTFTNMTDDALSGIPSINFTGVEPDTVYEVRYRYRNSSSCESGDPGNWSLIGEGRTSGGTGMDTQPSFAAGSSPGNQSFTVGTAISALTLPEASGGDGSLTYSLTPSVPGLRFNATTRRFTGTPTTAGTHSMTYTVTDSDGDTDSLTFTVAVDVPGGGTFGHAPADQASFARLVAENRFHAEGYHIDFPSAGRFLESSSLPGSYSYVNTNSNSGTLTLIYDGEDYGGNCTLLITFASETAGTMSYTCVSGDAGQSSWTITAGDVPPKPVLVPRSDAELGFDVVFIDSFAPEETRAYDYQIRKKAAGEVWRTFCDKFTNPTNNALARGTPRKGFLGLEPATVYQVRYRYRNSSSCESGDPGNWSLIGEGRTSGGTGMDTQPSFAAGSGPGDQSYTVGTAINVLTLPEASGGDGSLTYSLTPSVPGLSFNATTRRLIGTPTTAGAYSMTYTVSDTDGDTDSLTFTVAVEVPGGGEGHAPADQASFARLVAENRFHAEGYHIDFPSAGRFLESSSLPGSYSYVNTNSNSGTLTLIYDGEDYGGSCTLLITFASETAGTMSYTCVSGDAGQSTWTITAGDVPPKPVLVPRSDAELGFDVVFIDSFAPEETRAYDYQIRKKAAGEVWRTFCDKFTNPTNNALARGTPRKGFLGLEPATVYQVRYRYRNSSSCESGDPGNWSLIGEGKASGVQELGFSESGSVIRDIPENLPGGINVGVPVSAVGGDALTYSVGGVDAERFEIVPETGQIRTSADVWYDYETMDSYQIEVTVEDDAGNRETIDVAINLHDLEPRCNSVDDLRLRINSGDRRLTARWNPLPDAAGHARVLGYQTEIRRSNTGIWTDQRTYLGQSITGVTYADLDNGIEYQIRVRSVNTEDECGWSTPVSGIPTDDLAPRNDIEHVERFGPHPIGTDERNFRMLTPGRCRHMADGVNLDADCSYERMSPNSGRITLEFDDPSRGSCDVTLAYSSLTAGSFLDECFDAGVNTNVPFDRSFRVPRLPSGTDGSPPPPEIEPQRVPRNQDEFDSLVFGRDDLIPGLGFGCLPIVSGCKLGAGTNGFAYSFRLNSDTGRPAFNLGKYTYENTGPSSGLIRFVDAHGNIFKFALEFERWGNIRVTITDDEGEATTWPGMDHLDLTLGAQPILLPIPPSWSAAIAIETDNYAFETHSWDISFKLQSQLFPDWDDLIFSEGGLDFSKSFSRVGRNRFVYTLKFRMRDPSLVYGRNEEESNRRRKLNGSEWSFVVTITSDGGAEFSLTVSKEGNPTITEEGFVDFTEDGDDSDPDEFPEELKLPDEQPQASGQDLPDLEVAAAITALDIGNDDLQPLLVSAEGGGFQPGDWLEPKDGGNQRMMVVSAGLPTSLSALVAEYIPPDPMALSAAAPALEYLPSGGLALAPPAPEYYMRVGSLAADFKTQVDLGPYMIFGIETSRAVQSNPSEFATADGEFVRLNVVCMQFDQDIPTRGARYFSVAKTAEGLVQLCQKQCVLNESTNIQGCVWGCEEE